MTDQFSLFADKASGPEGLRYLTEFISEATERKLIDKIQALPLMPFQFGQYEGKRRIASFGFSYDYTLKRLQDADPFPPWLEEITSKIEMEDVSAGDKIEQVLCTEYDVGVGIGWHRDKPHFGKIFGLSLGTDCRLRFRRPAGARWDRFALNALPRSLYIMAGESRSVWEHSIPAVEAPRYSITFRTMSGLKR
jgi:alkylated DNA repair dioxygenase AlkB